VRQQLAERAAFFVRREGEGAAAFAARIYSRAFGADIERLLRITSLWEKPGRVAPTALPAADAGVAARVGELLSVSAASSSACASLGLCNQNALWSRDEAQAVFLLALARLAMLQQSHAGAPLTFDKDDALAVEFVAAAALLRGQNYGISGQSLFAAKGMAGNIIHAIATTNAIISGLIVLQAIKVLRGQLAATRNVYLWQFPSVQRKGTRLLLPEPPQAPTPSCYVCERARMQVSLDLGSWTLGAFCEKVLAPKFGVLQPCLIHGQAFYFEHGEEGMEEDELAANAALRAKLLRDVPGGLKDGDILAVSDQATSLRFELKLMQRTQWDADTDNEGFLVQGEVCKPVAQDAGPAEPAEPAPAPEDDHAFQMLDEAPAEAAGAKRKRSTEAQEGAHAANKKGKAAGAAEEDDGFVMLD
jgi:ubiquitin-like 1-activating enzyme E1 B